MYHRIWADYVQRVSYRYASKGKNSDDQFVHVGTNGRSCEYIHFVDSDECFEGSYQTCAALLTTKNFKVIWTLLLGQIYGSSGELRFYDRPHDRRGVMGVIGTCLHVDALKYLTQGCKQSAAVCP